MLPRVSLKRPRIATFQRDCAIGDGSEVVTVRKVTPTRQIARKAPKRKPLRFGGVPQNPQFVKFVHTKPCILTGLRVIGPLGTLIHVHICSGKLEAAHTGRRGLKQKAADETALPMCTNGHRTGQYSHHRIGNRFWEVWGIDKSKLIGKFVGMAREAGIKIFEGFVI